MAAAAKDAGNLEEFEEKLKLTDIAKKSQRRVGYKNRKLLK